MSATRPTKKQRELLSFIEAFIVGHGYGPSYREIMRALGYKSVSTVATHIDNLIKRGHLHKRDNSARSLEIVKQPSTSANGEEVHHARAQEAWLIDLIDHKFARLETTSEVYTEEQLDDLHVLISAMHILGLTAATAFESRLLLLKRAHHTDSAS